MEMYESLDGGMRSVQMNLRVFKINLYDVFQFSHEDSSGVRKSQWYAKNWILIGPEFQAKLLQICSNDLTGS